MKKLLLNLVVTSFKQLNDRYFLLKLFSDIPLPEIAPGQFVEVKVDHSPATYLRRPISIHFVDYDKNELWLLVANVGEGTNTLSYLREGDVLNCLFPLGKGFRIDDVHGKKILLVGGGVGVAPMLYYGKLIKENGGDPTFLLGYRTKADIIQMIEYSQYGEVCITTEDGTAGEKGFVTQHSVLSKVRFDRIATCGPKPMMIAVVGYAKQSSIPCEASLENLMACGLGACLCCVEKTIEGNLCVCKDGPVFDVERLLW